MDTFEHIFSALLPPLQQLVLSYLKETNESLKALLKRKCTKILLLNGGFAEAYLLKHKSAPFHEFYFHVPIDEKRQPQCTLLLYRESRLLNKHTFLNFMELFKVLHVFFKSLRKQGRGFYRIFWNGTDSCSYII